MNESAKIRCEICRCEISSDNSYKLNGKIVCDDCFLEQSHRVVACNPLATYSAKRFQKMEGFDVEDRLSHQQKLIYNFVRTHGKATLQTLKDNFNLSQIEIENQAAILRHLELTKAKKEGNTIYIVPF